LSASARAARPALALVAVSAAAWVGTVLWGAAAGMRAMPGTMGMQPVAFTVMWTLMMAAMMLPSIAPFLGVYQRTMTEQRGVRLCALASGYLGVWAASGVAAFLVADLFAQLAAHHTTLARAAAVMSFVAAGVWQLSPLKFQCLSHCRSPLAHLVHYLGLRGPLRDLRAGISHGAYCLGCCWALMLLMPAFGVMNLGVMVALAVTVAIEKLWRYGERFAQVVGVTCLVCAAALAFAPVLPPGLDPGAMMPSGGPR